MSLRELGGSFVVKSDINATWNLISKLDAVISCMPIIKEFEIIDENTARIKAQVRLGIIPLEGEGTFTFIRREKPKFVKGRARMVKGTLSEAGAVKEGETEARVDVALQLEPMSELETKVSYTAKFEVIGSSRLRKLYTSLIEKKASSIIQDFIKNLQDRLSSLQ